VRKSSSPTFGDILPLPEGKVPPTGIPASKNGQRTFAQRAEVANLRKLNQLGALYRPLATVDRHDPKLGDGGPQAISTEKMMR
jgi:hypothetical protein